MCYLITNILSNNLRKTVNTYYYIIYIYQPQYIIIFERELQIYDRFDNRHCYIKLCFDFKLYRSR